jgi:transcriptional repressor NrdR
VLDTRLSEDGTAIRRRRCCVDCDRRFTTIETVQLQVMKRSGALEPFNRDKVVAGVKKACKGRPVSDSDLAKLGQHVEETCRQQGRGEIDSQEIGQAVLEPLSRLDQVAYLRFASIYGNYQSLDDFEQAIGSLRASSPAPL